MEQIPYTVRESARARHVRLTVSARDGLVVVVPRGSRVDVETIVHSRREWALAALGQVASRREEHLSGTEAQLPSVLELRALRETWPVEYRHTESARVSARLDGGLVVVSGGVDDAEACAGALRRLVDRIAHDALSDLLEEGVDVAGVAPKRLRIGAPRSRWGSCSGRGTISLSRNLMFFPRPLALHVVLHELAHLKHPDHSRRFHAHLASLDPLASTHRVQLASAREHVPVWADI